ncbi:ATP-dependent DNA helicase RecG [Mitsuokella jalaludinii]|uniref:ATP-dependent DNA helicase RecG n=1 Tax=Mitsuokella jalaludinii TaxID=187979 RepID=UPI00242EDC7B|nr:ATP-dependent DNA helicase RecG [Mitsuokella jalaludinii]MCI6610945.1 ATP-dependent DNA helicase RecG [Mitsuokella jalaludinii]
MKIQDSVQYLKGVGPKKKAELARLGIATVYDLLTYFPRTYEDQSVLTRIADLRPGTVATVAGTIVNLQEQTGRRGLTILTAYLNDGTGILQVTWFNQKYLKKTLKAGRRVFVSGKAAYAYGGRGQFAMSQLRSFQVLEPGEQAQGLCGILPVYAATEHLNQKFFRTLIAEALEAAGDLPELIPARILAAHHLMGRREALHAAHFPKDGAELKRARYRLAFSELYLIQCGLLLLKKQSQETKRGIRHQPSGKLVKAVLAGLPFTLTHDQQQAWQEICRDMERTAPMRRLVQGDVGSGKTVIAMLALVKTVENGRQGAMMAPTEILAAQHYENLSSKLAPLGIRVGYLSGHLTPKKRRAMHEAIARHEVDIIIGTHALIQDDVHFTHLGLVITDEQHRFGIAQRATLEKKGAHVPDVLVMTATPIPRTMTLTVYGDLDVSLIRELPPGRQPIRTFVRRPDRRPLIYQYVRSQIEAGRQAYVVCPLIEMNEESDLPSAEEVYDELRYGIFSGIPCGLVHGRLAPAEKERVMQDFYADRIKLLVATTVIEVGVNVPNASIMVIEHAERFGLAQLHQLRGRIGRGSYASYCILVSEGKTENARERLRIMAETSDGFKLAEEDLRLRGPGQFFGSMQHGLPDLKIARVPEDLAILLDAHKAAEATLLSQGDLDFIRPILALQYKERFAHIMEN